MTTFGLLNLDSTTSPSFCLVILLDLTLNLPQIHWRVLQLSYNASMPDTLSLLAVE